MDLWNRAHFIVRPLSEVKNCNEFRRLHPATWAGALKILILGPGSGALRFLYILFSNLPIPGSRRPGSLLELPGLVWAAWSLLGAPGRSWALLGAPGRFWALLGAPGRSWALLGAPGRSWALLGAPGRSSEPTFSPGHSPSAGIHR